MKTLDLFIGITIAEFLQEERNQEKVRTAQLMYVAKSPIVRELLWRKFKAL